MYYAFLIFVYTHIIGCIMWLSFKSNNRWIPAVDFGAIDTKIHLDYRFRSEPMGSDNSVVVPLSDTYLLLYEWFSSWYNSAIGFALVEVNARTSNQVAFMFCVYVINAIINAYLIGVFID